MCLDDARYGSRAFVVESEEIAAVYHGWAFARSPAAGFPGYCRRG